MELRILKGRELLGSALAEQILELDRRNMQAVFDQAGLEFPLEKRRKGLESDATFILAFDGETLAGYLDYLRSWTNPEYIYIGSVQIEKRYRGSSVLLRLLDQFRTLVTAEDFVGFETNVQKVNVVAANLYHKLGFTLEPNPRNNASWTARASKTLLTDSPLATLLNRWRIRGHLRADLIAFSHYSIPRIVSRMSFTFEWDEEKATENLTKHRVSFSEASTVFGDPLSRTIPDPVHSEDEERFVMLGESRLQHILVVVHAFRGEVIRIISARAATPSEKRAYERRKE